tara:strand:- start:323 stop:760 length:438 start_codon:yes stop_codon:yes gene_type:complete
MNEEKPKKQFIIVKSIIVDKGKILFVKREREWHKEAHGKWEFPGGKVDFGETPEEACEREAKEESGYDVKVKSLVPKIVSSQWEHPDRLSQQILIAYVCEVLSGEASLDDHGVSEVKWFTVEEAIKLDCLPGTHDFLKIYLELGK